MLIILVTSGGNGHITDVWWIGTIDTLEWNRIDYIVFADELTARA